MGRHIAVLAAQPILNQVITIDQSSSRRKNYLVRLEHIQPEWVGGPVLTILQLLCDLLGDLMWHEIREAHL